MNCAFVLHLCSNTFSIHHRFAQLTTSSKNNSNAIAQNLIKKMRFEFVRSKINGKNSAFFSAVTRSRQMLMWTSLITIIKWINRLAGMAMGQSLLAFAWRHEATTEKTNEMPKKNLRKRQCSRRTQTSMNSERKLYLLISVVHRFGSFSTQSRQYLVFPSDKRLWFVRILFIASTRFAIVNHRRTIVTIDQLLLTQNLRMRSARTQIGVTGT